MKLISCIILLIFTFGFACAEELPQNQQKYFVQMPGDYVLGNFDAKVTFIEYSSLSCPSCASFHDGIFSDLKEKYIDKGLVKYIHRNYPLNEQATKAAVLPICGGKEKYYLFLQSLFETQRSWTTTKDYIPILEAIGELGGVSKKQLTKCFNDKDIENQIMQSRLDAHNILQVNSTPTIIINGEKVVGAISQKKLFEILDLKLKNA
jgi:protein-disulfide isomerase